MTPSNAPKSDTAPADEDLAAQANPGHGIPSQDPDSAAQVMLQPDEAKREAKSALVGGGAVAGATAGVAIGFAVAGPVGVVAGAVLGATAGVLGGAAAGAATNTDDADAADTASKKIVQSPADAGGGGGGGGGGGVSSSSSSTKSPGPPRT